MVYCHFVAAWSDTPFRMTQKILTVVDFKGKCQNSETLCALEWLQTQMFPTQAWRDPSVTSSFPILLSLISVLFCLPTMSLGFLPLCKGLSCSVFCPASSVLGLLFEVSFLCISAGQVFYILENHKGSYRGKGDSILKTRRVVNIFLS